MQNASLKARPTHPPVDVNGNPLVLNQAQARALAKLQATWDEHDDKAFSALMKACIKDPKTKKLTETEDFEHALPLLNRLEERYLSDIDRQKGVAWSQFFNFTAQASESGYGPSHPLRWHCAPAQQLKRAGYSSSALSPFFGSLSSVEGHSSSASGNGDIHKSRPVDLRSDESQIREERTPARTWGRSTTCC
jgi:hypothetical protein